MVVNPIFAKKLQIHKCYATNGTVIFQEDSCEFGSNKKDNSQDNKISKYNIQKPIVNVQMVRSPSGSSRIKFATKIVSNHVKGHDISLWVKQSWTVVNKVYNNKLLHLELTENKRDIQLDMLVDFIYTDGKHFSEEELVELIYLSVSRFVKGSKEGQINIVSFPVNSGKGVMTTLTNEAMGFADKTLSKGAIYKNGWLIQFTYNGEDTNSHSHQVYLLSMFKNMQITKL